MSDVEPFGLLILVVAAVGLLAVLSNRLSERVRIPAPLFFLAGAAVAAALSPSLHGLPHRTMERLVTVALVVILFDGGLHIGRRRLKAAAAPIALVGVAGTFLTAAAVAALARLAFGFDWWVALLLGTAVAPTDPAVVFSVLGKRQVGGRSGTVLEGESGANDPVGIALMAGLLGAGGVSAASSGAIAGDFVLQMVVGGGVGVAGGLALLALSRRVPLPAEGLYPLRALAGAFLLFGAATLAHGSGFLAVFAAGLVLGDAGAPYKREVERFHSALAGLGEIVAFVVLGLSVDLRELTSVDVWGPGLVLGAALAFAIRPVLVGICLLPFGFSSRERAFIGWAGLKGAVPILLGSFLLEASVPDPQRLYGVIVVVVAFSVLVQGSTLPLAARLLRIAMRTVEPEPWAVGVRLRHEPEEVSRRTIGSASVADGRTVAEVDSLLPGMSVVLALRDGRVVPLRDDLRLQAEDDVLLLGAAEDPVAASAVFTPAAPAKDSSASP
jgi:cell volume regulation protein A